MTFAKSFIHESVDVLRRPLVIVVSHPIQYQVPLPYLAARTSVEPVVLLLSEHGLKESFDPGLSGEKGSNRLIRPSSQTSAALFGSAMSCYYRKANRVDA